MSDSSSVWITEVNYGNGDGWQFFHDQYFTDLAEAEARVVKGIRKYIYAEFRVSEFYRAAPTERARPEGK